MAVLDLVKEGFEYLDRLVGTLPAEWPQSNLLVERSDIFFHEFEASNLYVLILRGFKEKYVIRVRPEA